MSFGTQILTENWIPSALCVLNHPHTLKQKPEVAQGVGLSKSQKAARKQTMLWLVTAGYLTINSFGTDTKTFLHIDTLLIMALNTMFLCLIINKPLEKISKEPKKNWPGLVTFYKQQ